MDKNQLLFYIKKEIKHYEMDGYAQLLELPPTHEGGYWQLEILGGVYALMLDFSGDVYHHKDFNDVDDLANYCYRIYTREINPTMDF